MVSNHNVSRSTPTFLHKTSINIEERSNSRDEKLVVVVLGASSEPRVNTVLKVAIHLINVSILSFFSKHIRTLYGVNEYIFEIARHNIWYSGKRGRELPFLTKGPNINFPWKGWFRLRVQIPVCVDNLNSIEVISKLVEIYGTEREKKNAYSLW